MNLFRMFVAMVAIASVLLPLGSRCWAAPTEPYAPLIEGVLARDRHLPVPMVRAANDADEEAKLKAEIMRSDAMADVLVWLADYFAVSVQYNEEQTAKFYANLSQMSSGELRLFLRKAERLRTQLRDQWNAGERLREQTLAMSRDRGKERAEAGNRSTPAQFFAYDGYFRPPTFAGQRMRGYWGYGPRPPLITSSGVAQFVVFDEFWNSHAHRHHR